MTLRPTARLLGAAWRDRALTAENYAAYCPGPPGRLSTLTVFPNKLILYSAFVWARRVLNRRKRRFLARAVRGLLALEEEQMEGDIGQYAQYNIALRPHRDYPDSVILEVKGVPERRPPLAFGDSIFVRLAQASEAPCRLTFSTTIQPP